MAKKGKTIIIQTKPAGPDGIQLVLPELEAVFTAHEGCYTKHALDFSPQPSGFVQTSALVSRLNKE